MVILENNKNENFKFQNFNGKCFSLTPFLEAEKHMRADLTKGSFGHFSSFYVIKNLETSKISIFCMFLQESQIASNI